MLQSTLNAQFDLQVTEIFPGQTGSDLTEDWFEVTNVGDQAWISGVDGDLYYDDESADPAVADLGLSFVSAATAGSELFQNSPNPFGTQTQIAFNLEVAGTATLLVQNQNGQLLRSYEIDAAAGRNVQTITRQELGNALGVLTCTIIAEGFTATRKMILQ
ncbi:hypothetical protein CEQ90_08935 [Lewinellaceae bacterium SD302]|nr:hypothetical protein CEQ90_08935 [Lewinellaceae bacterium SD302]